MVIGVAMFVTCSFLVGVTPSTSWAEAWIIGFRFLQGVGAALLFPAAIARPTNMKRPAPMDCRGLALLVGGMILAILGLQQAGTWGWTSPATIG